MARVLYHIDLNAFFASAEELRHPELKGKPLAIGSPGPRGVLSTCNYAARQFGIHSAMPTSQARALCEELVILPGDYEYYRSLSGRFFDYLRQYSGRLEVLSIDECFLDVTETIAQFERPMDLAVMIQRGVLDTLGLSCSIGVAPTRFLAKMASDLRKPMGISIVRRRDIATKIYPLDIEDCYGVGKATVKKLRDEGIETIGDLMEEENEAVVKRIFGNSWPVMQSRLTGRSSDRLIFSTTRKSVSHSKTFPSDLYTLEEVLEQAAILTRQVAASMTKHHKKGQSVSVVLRDGSFHNEVHSARLPRMSSDEPVLQETVRSIVLRYFEPVGYRHLGISVGSLADEDQIVIQPSLFDTPQETTGDVLASLNRQIEGGGLMRLSDLLKDRESKDSRERES